MSSTNDRCPGISSEHIDAAQTIWNYMKVDDPLEKVSMPYYHTFVT